jgi:1-deoxy-D-xylulose-5-phosphate reductoisomerase
MKHAITILGATGSIGQSTLKILAQHPDLYQLYAISGMQRMAELVDICIQYSPKVVAIPTAQQQYFLTLAHTKRLK